MTHIHIKGKKSWKRLDIAESGGSKDLYIFVLLLFAQNFDTGLFFVPPFKLKGGTFF